MQLGNIAFEGYNETQADLLSVLCPGEDQKEKREKFADFLKILETKQLLNNKNSTSIIMHADDQYVNRQAMKFAFLSQGKLSQRFVAVSSGEEILNMFEQQLSILSSSGDIALEQPISLLLIDINL